MPPLVKDEKLSVIYMARYRIFNTKLQVISTSETVYLPFSPFIIEKRVGGASAEAQLIVCMHTVICQQGSDYLSVQILSRKHIRII